MPHATDIPQSDQTNGQRLAALRMRRRWTQQRLATEAGYSLPAVKAFERGARSLDRASVILQFAAALDCHPTEITGQPVMPATDQDGQQAVAAVAAVYRALLMHGRTPRITDGEAAAVDLADLRATVATANRYRQTAALAKSGRMLAQLLRDLQIAAHVLSGDRREAHDLMASAYECAMQFLYKLGRAEAATLATERVLLAARETEDPLRMLSARWYEAGEYLNIGEHDEASAIIDQALGELGGMRGAGPEAVSLTGAFQLKGALNAARAADGKAAARHLQQAEVTASELGEDRNDYQLQFGPTNVAIWGVTVPVELGHGRDAVRQAEHVANRLPATYSAERRSHYYIDLGRGYWYNGQHDEALQAFLSAEEIAPQQTRMHAGVRETVRTMIRTQRRSQLVELGMRLGAV